MNGTDHSTVADSLDSLATILQRRGQFKEAQARGEEALAIRRRVLGPRDEKVAGSLQILGVIASNQSADYTRAVTLMREELDIRRSLASGDNAKVAATLNNIAVNRMRLKDFTEAESLYRESLGIFRRALGDDYPDVAATLENLGQVYFRTKRYDEAFEMLNQVLAMRRKKLGDNHMAGRTCRTWVR